MKLRLRKHLPFALSTATLQSLINAQLLKVLTLLREQPCKDNCNTFESCVAFCFLFYLRNDGLCLRVGEDFWPLNRWLIGVAVVVMGVLVIVLMMLIRKMT